MTILFIGSLEGFEYAVVLGEKRSLNSASGRANGRSLYDDAIDANRKRDGLIHSRPAVSYSVPR